MKLFSTSHLQPSTLDLISRANAISAYIDGGLSSSSITEGKTYDEVNQEFDTLITTIIPLVAPNNVDEYVRFPVL